MAPNPVVVMVLLLLLVIGSSRGRKCGAERPLIDMGALGCISALN